MFQVFDNNKPAEYPQRDEWKNSKFTTFDEAQAYARKWLKCGGIQSCPCDHVVLTLGVPHAYNGRGDMLEIRKV